MTRSGLPGRYVGRVGALAVALGVGGILAPAIASADDTPNRPSHAAHAADRLATPRAAANRTSPPRQSASAALRAARSTASRHARGESMTSASNPFATRPARRVDPAAPVALPVAWAGAAVTRREFSGAVRVGAPAAAAVAVAAADPGATSAPDTVAGQPAVGAGLGAASVFDDFQRYIDAIVGDVAQWIWANGARPAISGAVTYFINQYLPEWRPLMERVAPIVVDGVGDWIFNDTVAPEVNRLTSDPVVLQTISNAIAGQITAVGVPAEAGVAVGNAAATWVNLAFSGEQGRPVREAFDTLLADLPGLPSGWDVTRLLWEFTFNGYTFKQLINDQVGIPLQSGIGDFLATPGVQQALSEATAGAVSVLLGNTGPSWDPSAIRSIGVAALVGDGLGQGIALALLGDQPDAASLRTTVSDIVTRLVNNPVLGDAAVRTVGTTIATLLAQPEIRDAVAISASNVLRAALGVPQESVPLLQDAVGTTVTNGVGTLLADTGVIAAVGRAFQDVFAGLMSNSAVQVLIGDAFAVPLGNGAGQAVTELLGTPGFRDGLAAALGSVPMNLLGSEDVRAAVAAAFGQLARDVTAGVPFGDATTPVLTSLLDNPAVRRAFGSTATLLVIDVIDNLATWAGVVTEEPTSRALATYVGTAVTGFLNYPGITTVLTDMVDVVVTNAVDGTHPGNALYELQTNPTYRDALGATIPSLVGSVFGDSALRQAIGRLASVGVVELMRGTALDMPILNVAVGQAAYASVTSLLADTQVAQLVSTLAVGALSAVPSNELINTALRAVLTEFGLQAAIGFALGKGVGALFGDNNFATAFGEVTGAAATLVIAAVAGVTRLFVGDFAPPAAASIETGRVFVALPVGVNA